MSIQDYKNATAKLREFSEYYEVNRYKTFEEKLMEFATDRIRQTFENALWFGRCVWVSY